MTNTPEQQIEAVFGKVCECLDEIIGCLCYQNEIPYQHKVDMVNKLEELGKVCAAHFQKTLKKEVNNG